jgi:uncharacterized glyoxalase superfamily protein PhnB
MDNEMSSGSRTTIGTDGAAAEGVGAGTVAAQAGPDHNVWVGLSYEDPLAAREWLRALGAVVQRPLEETEYGSRGFSVVDPERTSWSFGTYAG